MGSFFYCAVQKQETKKQETVGRQLAAAAEGDEASCRASSMGRRKSRRKSTEFAEEIAADVEVANATLADPAASATSRRPTVELAAAGLRVNDLASSMLATSSDESSDDDYLAHAEQAMACTKFLSSDDLAGDVASLELAQEAAAVQVSVDPIDTWVVDKHSGLLNPPISPGPNAHEANEVGVAHDVLRSSGCLSLNEEMRRNRQLKKNESVSSHFLIEAETAGGTAPDANRAANTEEEQAALLRGLEISHNAALEDAAAAKAAEEQAAAKAIEEVNAANAAEEAAVKAAEAAAAKAAAAKAVEAAKARAAAAKAAEATAGAAAAKAANANAAAKAAAAAEAAMPEAVQRAHWSDSLIPVGGNPHRISVNNTSNRHRPSAHSKMDRSTLEAKNDYLVRNTLEAKNDYLSGTVNHTDNTVHPRRISLELLNSVGCSQQSLARDNYKLLSSVESSIQSLQRNNLEHLNSVGCSIYSLERKLAIQPQRDTDGGRSNDHANADRNTTTTGSGHGMGVHRKSGFVENKQSLKLNLQQGNSNQCAIIDGSTAESAQHFDPAADTPRTLEQAETDMKAFVNSIEGAAPIGRFSTDLSGLSTQTKAIMSNHGMPLDFLDS